MLVLVGRKAREIKGVVAVAHQKSRVVRTALCDDCAGADGFRIIRVAAVNLCRLYLCAKGQGPLYVVRCLAGPSSLKSCVDNGGWLSLVGIVSRYG